MPFPETISMRNTILHVKTLNPYYKYQYHVKPFILPSEENKMNLYMSLKCYVF